MRAMIMAQPAAKRAVSRSAGTARSQAAPGRWPKASSRITRAAMETSSCWKSCTTVEMGRLARGKCSARTRPRLLWTARVPALTELLTKSQTKMPVIRKGT